MPATLPVLRTAPRDPPPFPRGSRVKLASCPGGQPGTVVGVKYGRVLVHWADLRMTGKHKAETLVAAS